MQPLVLRDGQLLENVTISLFHGGAIAGRIVDAHGDPVENAQVRAARVVRSGRPQTMGQVQSNDLGEYRLPRLQPGRYIVQVRPQPSQGFQGAFMEGGPADVPLPQPIPTYYPGALAISQAQPLTVARGETLSGVDIMLVEGTPSLVTGTVVRADGGPVAGGSVTSRVVGSEMSGGFDFGGGTGIRQGGVFQITLPPGEVRARSQCPDDDADGARATIAGRSDIWHGSDLPWAAVRSRPSRSSSDTAPQHRERLSSREPPRLQRLRGRPTRPSSILMAPAADRELSLSPPIGPSKSKAWAGRARHRRNRCLDVGR